MTPIILALALSQQPTSLEATRLNNNGKVERISIRTRGLDPIQKMRCQLVLTYFQAGANIEHLTTLTGGARHGLQLRVRFV